MMKARYIPIFVLALFTPIIAEIAPFKPLIMHLSEIIHENAELGKVCLNSDGSNTIFSKEYNKQGSVFMSKIDKDGNFVYHNSKFNTGYSIGSQLNEIKTSTGDNAYAFYYKSNGKEYLTEFKDKGVDLQNPKDLNSYHAKASLLTLKNGYIFFAGIESTSQFAQTRINVKVYDPQTKIAPNTGLTINAYSHLVSCAEVKDNEVYCAYVQEEDVIKRHILKLQYFKVKEDGTIINENQPYLIKAFYTEFNMLKVVKISQTEIGIVFQTGTGKETEKIPYGNTGKDLYFYHLEVTPTNMEVVRYDYIYNNCRLRADPEDYTVDIISLPNKKIFGICEVDNGGKDPDKFQLLEINGQDKQFIQTTLGDLGKVVRNPQFVKFGDTAAILYTRIDANGKSDVVLLKMNYPDCEDAKNNFVIYEVCPYGTQTLLSSIGSYFNIFLNNPYPSSMSSTPLYFRIVAPNELKILNGNTELELNKDYDISILSSLSIKEFASKDNSYIEYTVSRKENNNQIFGKTCKIKLDFPKCLDQCKGCDKTGTEEDHRCFDCKYDNYYEEVKGTDNTGCGKEGKLYNCKKCNVACEKCYGPYDNDKPTTNCKEKFCNTAEGYYPYEGNYTICFKKEEKDDWKQKLHLECALFLDNSSKVEKEWVWRCCDPHCESCHLRNTTNNHNCDTCRVDKGFFFFCNQTQDHGIPGSCHESCVGDGCYKSNPSETEGMEKMCPCLDHCKECENNKTCEVCYPTWFLHHEKTSCDNKCDYCYTPIYEDEAKKEKGKCINCKTYYAPEEQYTFGNKCYTKNAIPSFSYTRYNSTLVFSKIEKKYHVMDEFCNLLTACKEGCKKCTDLFTDKCTECEEGYYMQDPYNKTNMKSFQCYSKRVCQGNDTYPNNDLGYRHGGVPIEEDGRLVCLNCRQRNNSFRWPEENYFCGERLNRTYIDIPEYNKLSYCYVRCKTCDKWGNPCAMNCLSCRDSKYYDLIRYDKYHGQCYRKQHKCGIYPYYHNYDLAIDEDNCGEDCDVCLYNFQCPREFPYLKPETRECVEFCPFTDIMGGACNVNYTWGIIQLLRNPFGLRNPYGFLNQTVDIQQIISSQLFQYFCGAYRDCPLISGDIYNYIGNGKIYNLPQSQIYIGNNISIELSSVKLELEKIKKYMTGEEVKVNITKIKNIFAQPEEEKDKEEEVEEEEEETYTPSGVNFSECSAILKKRYGLSEEEDLLIIKSELLYQQNTSDASDLIEKNTTKFQILGTETDYQLFSTSLGAFLPLQACIDAEEGITVHNPFTNKQVYQFQSKTGSVISNGYDIFDANSPFYNDVCTPFTNENGNDVLLDARRKDYYNENVNLCGDGCKFNGYNTLSQTYECKCNIKSEPGADAGEYTGEVIERTMPKNFKDLISRRSNIAVFKCASKVFSSEGQKANFGSYILLAGIASFVGVLVFHFVKERSKAMNSLYSKIAKVSNPPKMKKGEDNKEDKKDENKEEKKEEKKEDKKSEKKKKTKKSKISGVENKEKNVEKKNYDEFIKKPEGVVKDLVYEDDQYNFAPFDDVNGKDTRSFLQTYWSFLKFKQSIIFTFYTRSYGILRSTKVALFILFVGFYMAFTALFFNDDIMRALYIYKGNANAAVHIPNIILSSICSFIASLIIRYVCLNERDTNKVLTVREPSERKALADRAKKCAAIKLYIFYALSALLIVLCWYYVAAFCAVFKNSQKNYLINFAICFLVCNLWPFITSFIPTIMRRVKNNKNNPCLYKASQIVSIF